MTIKNSNFKLFALFVFLLAAIYFVINQRYGIYPRYWEIIRLLEAKNIAIYHHLLGSLSFSFITNSIGKPYFVLPSIIFSPLSLFSTNGSVPQLFNLLVLGVSFHLLLKAFIPQISPLKNYLYSLLLILTPWIWHTGIVSLDASLFLLSLSIFIYYHQLPIQIVTLVSGLLLSPSSIIIFPFIILGNYLNGSQKPKIFLLSLIFVLVSTFVLLKPKFISTYFPILMPQSHEYFIQIHRQSDLTFGAPFLGKVYYNKYIVIAQKVFVNSLSYLDWDRYVFIGNSGKSENRPFDYPQLSLFEFPFLLLGLTFIISSHHRFLCCFLIGSVLAAAMVAPIDDPGIYLWLTLGICSILGLESLSLSSIPKISLLSLILLSKSILVNLDLANANVHFSITKAYSKISSLINQSPGGHYVVTDAIGQPHIYLAYFSLIPLTDLNRELSNTQIRDKDFLIQPTKINQFQFGSYNHDILSADFPLDKWTWVVTSTQLGDESTSPPCQCTLQSPSPTFDLNVGSKTVLSRLVLVKKTANEK